MTYAEWKNRKHLIVKLKILNTMYRHLRRPYVSLYTLYVENNFYAFEIAKMNSFVAMYILNYMSLSRSDLVQIIVALKQQQTCKYSFVELSIQKPNLIKCEES